MRLYLIDKYFSNQPSLRRAQCLLVASTLLLNGCGSLLDVVGPPLSLYNLTPKSTYNENLPEVSWQLVIEEPLASGGLDSSRIAMRPTPTGFKYFADARWTERAPKMVQTLIIESFENTGKIIAVGRHAIGLRSDFNLKTELREFQAEYFHGDNSPVITIRINAKLVKQPRQYIIASKSFEKNVTAADGSLPNIIDAFDDALGKVVKALVRWTLNAPALQPSSSSSQ